MRNKINHSLFAQFTVSRPCTFIGRSLPSLAFAHFSPAWWGSAEQNEWMNGSQEEYTMSKCTFISLFVLKQIFIFQFSTSIQIPIPKSISLYEFYLFSNWCSVCSLRCYSCTYCFTGWMDGWLSWLGRMTDGLNGWIDRCACTRNTHCGVSNFKSQTMLFKI